MNNKGGLVVIAAGIAAFLIIKGGRDSGSMFGSGGGDSGQPTGTILAGPGTSPPAPTPAPSSLWSPSPSNYSPPSFGYVTPTGTYITQFPISDKILAAMNGNVQPATKTYGGSSPQAKSELSLIASKGFSTVGLQGSYDPSTRTAYTFAPETATVEKKLISRQGFDTTGLQGSFDPLTGKITTFGGNGMVTYGKAPLPKPASNTVVTPKATFTNVPSTGFNTPTLQTTYKNPFSPAATSQIGQPIQPHYIYPTDSWQATLAAMAGSRDVSRSYTGVGSNTGSNTGGSYKPKGTVFAPNSAGGIAKQIMNDQANQLASYMKK